MFVGLKWFFRASLHDDRERRAAVAKCIDDTLGKKLRSACRVEFDEERSRKPYSVDAVNSHLTHKRSTRAVMRGAENGGALLEIGVDTGRLIDDLDDSVDWHNGAYLEQALESTSTEAIIALALELSSVLDAALCAITCEATASLCESFLFTASDDYIAERKELGPLSERRARERAAYHFFSEDVGSKLPAPEWGLVLDDRHTEPLGTELPGLAVCRREAHYTLIQLTADIADAADYQAFEPRLDVARALLAPILSDLSLLPDYAV